MLKCDFHMHAREDALDWVPYGARELIEKAAALKFDVLAFTFHGQVLDDPAVTEFARQRGILLIPGCEAYVGRKEVLCFNITQAEVDSIKTFAALRAWKQRKGGDGLIVAPHPFYPLQQCLHDDFLSNLDLWDAVEYCNLHMPGLNLNRKAERIALEKNLPIVGTSDSHELFMFGNNYTLVDADKDMLSVFRAIRAGRIQRHAPALSPWRAAKTFWFMVFRHLIFPRIHPRKRQEWRQKRRKRNEAQGLGGDGREL